jgi:sortase A
MRIKGGGALRALEIGLMMIAVASLTAYGLLELEEYRGQAELQSEFEKAVASAPATPREKPAIELPGELKPSPGQPAPGPPPAAGAALGRLTSARIGLNVMVAEGVDDATLRRAAGHIPGTALLDSGGNVGVAAHRDTFFRPLREIRKGDELELETAQGRRRYRVEWTAVVEPENLEPLEETTAPALTLVTCFPFYYVGPAPRRFVVRAIQLDDGAGVVAASR